MTEEEVERLIKELRGGSVPNLSIGGGWIVAKKEHLSPKDMFEYLLITGELVECHKGLINIGDMQDVREHLREDLYYNVIEFIGVGYCHRMV